MNEIELDLIEDNQLRIILGISRIPTLMLHSHNGLSNDQFKQHYTILGD
jgi:hypothetical protein